CVLRAADAAADSAPARWQRIAVLTTPFPNRRGLQSSLAARGAFRRQQSFPLRASPVKYFVRCECVDGFDEELPFYCLRSNSNVSLLGLRTVYCDGCG